MNSKINEYLQQLTEEIQRIEERIAQCKKELTQDIATRAFYTIEEFGLAKYAEQITKLTGQLRVLYQQQHVFKAIFEVEQ